MSAAAPNPIAMLLAHAQQGGGAPMMGPPQQQEGQSVPANLKAALDALHAAFGAETDPQDKELIGKAMMIVQQIFTQEQKDKDAAMNGTNNPRMMRRNRP